MAMMRSLMRGANRICMNMSKTNTIPMTLSQFMKIDVATFTTETASALEQAAAQPKTSSFASVSAAVHLNNSLAFSDPDDDR